VEKEEKLRQQINIIILFLSDRTLSMFLTHSHIMMMVGSLVVLCCYKKYKYKYKHKLWEYEQRSTFPFHGFLNVFLKETRDAVPWLVVVVVVDCNSVNTSGTVIIPVLGYLLSLAGVVWSCFSTHLFSHPS